MLPVFVWAAIIAAVKVRAAMSRQLKEKQAALCVAFCDVISHAAGLTWFNAEL